MSRGAIANEIGLEVHRRRRRSGAFEQCGDPGPRTGLQQREPEPGDRAVLADDRRHVRHAADRGQVGQTQGRLRATWFVREQELGDLERDATAGQAAVRIGGIGSMRIDDRHGRRENGRHPVMVRDDHVEAAGIRLGDLRDAGRAAIHRDDHGGTGRRPPHRALAIDRPVALIQATRHVRFDRHPEASQGDGHDGQPGQAVRIEVAEDQHPFAGRPGRTQPIEDDGRIGQRRRVMEAVQRVPEPGGQLFVRGRPARRQQSRPAGR